MRRVGWSSTSLWLALLALAGALDRGAAAIEDRRTLERLQALGYLDGIEKAPDTVNVTIHDPRAGDGVNFYMAGHGPEAFLVDMTGAVLHTWRYDRSTFLREVRLPSDVRPPPPGSFFFRQGHLYPNGDILAIINGVALLKLDRHSRLVWAYTGRPHHDLEVAEDGTIYVLTHTDRVIPQFRRRASILDNYITQLDADGNELERVSLMDALYDGAQHALIAELRAVRAPFGDVLHANSLRMLDGLLSDRIPGFAKGNALISCPLIHALMVVDMRKKAVVWTLKGKFRYQHDATLLGDRTILLFDNQRGPTFVSAAMRVDPFSGAALWEYRGSPERPLYSWCCGTAHWLDGGDALIVETQGGRALQVTPEGEVVWEFVLPQRTDGDRIAQLFDLVRLPPDFPMHWVTRQTPQLPQADESVCRP
jgi:hypothetical protein